MGTNLTIRHTNPALSAEIRVARVAASMRATRTLWELKVEIEGRELDLDYIPGTPLVESVAHVVWNVKVSDDPTS